MKNKLFVGILATLIIALSVLALFSCAPGSNIPEDLDLSGITLDGATVFYDGGEHSLAVKGNLPENVTVVYEGNSRVEVGTYTVTAKFYYAGEYVVGKDISATLNIKALTELATPTVGMFDKTVDYDGSAHSITLEGSLPEGVTVEYVGNGEVDAGAYTVTAKFYYKGIYLDGRDLTADLVINKKSLDSAMYELAFNGTTVVHDGKEHSIYVSGNIPDCLDVTYEGNGVSAIGTHTVTATFTLKSDNYTLSTANMTAEIKIVELGLVVPDDLDLSGITLPGKTVSYDGEEHSLAISGTLPEDVTVEYVGNGKINAGSYSVVAKFYYKGLYLEGKNLTADLVIGKRSVALEGISFNSTTVLFDGKAHSIALTGTLPEGVTPVYSGNGVTEMGVHTVTVSFVTDANHEPITDTLTATIEIIIFSAESMGVEFPNGEFVYDGTEHSIAIKGEELLTSGITFIGYEGNGQKNVGEYTVTARFAYRGTYESALDIKATLVIKPAEIKVSAPQTQFDMLFDGTLKLPDALVWDGEKPDDITVELVGKAERYVGTYTFVYKFVVSDSAKDNYIAKDDITVTMNIIENPGFATEGIVFGEMSDGTYFVKGYVGSDDEVIIPATYNGAAVTAIAYGAFEGNTDIVYVRVPSSVIAIGQAAFRGCTSLEAITLPFVGGSHNTSNEYLGFIFGASGYVGNTQFVPESLKSVELVGARLVPAYSFWGCTSLTEVRINDAVEIGVSAFRGCSSLADVYIADSVVTIQGAAAINSPFIDCSEELTVHLTATAVPDGFTSTWCVISTDGTEAKVVLGK